MKTKPFTQTLLLGSLCLGLLSSPAFADGFNPSDFGHKVGGFFHHLFSQIAKPSSSASSNESSQNNSGAPISVTNTNNINSNNSSAQASAVVATQAPAPHIAPVQAVIAAAPSITPAPTATPYDACSEMAPGESRTVDYPTLNQAVFSVQVIPRYLLKRVSDNANGKAAYEAALNIQFVPHPGESIDTQAMLNYTSNCYAQLPPIEDADGNSIKIRLATPDEAKEAPLRSINLTDSHMDREDMTDWSTESDCRVLVHESLHLMGLVDLYQETSLKTAAGGQAYDCRKLGPNDSVMRDQGQAHFATSVYYETSCTCEHNNCAAELAAITQTPEYCPALASSTSIRMLINTYDIATNPSDEALFNTTYGPYLKTGNHSEKWIYNFFSLKPDTNSLLYPAEFRMITSPGCVAKNSLYLQCAGNAYRSTTDGAGCSAVANPDVCNDPSQWLK